MIVASHDSAAFETGIHIESREQLLSWLGEAAEIEHNLMCCYLYAMFSLKRGEADGLGAKQAAAVDRWRGVIRGVALEEMTHLTLVANLASAIGGSAHLVRPNFPMPAGAYPANLVMELAPFDAATLDHFIYVERPENAHIDDGAGFRASQPYARAAPRGRLMPYASDYDTVGALYRSVGEGIRELSAGIGEKELFCGGTQNQIGPLESQLPGLLLIADLDCAERALDVIVSQGEGSWGGENSHYERFCGIRDEYRALLAEDPAFAPARPVARNPVMRKPPFPENRVWVTNACAARYIDTANALYSQMLRLLAQVYAVPHAPAQRRALITGAQGLMHAMVPVAERLTHLPASEDAPGINGGMSFASMRSLAPLGSGRPEHVLIDERMGLLVRALTALRSNDDTLEPALQALLTQREALKRAFEHAEAPVAVATPTPTPLPIASTPPARTVAPVAGLPHGDGIEIANGKKLSLSFEARRCIHARHCVLSEPGVFAANTPGEWIFPDKGDVEELAGTLRNCPSGALQYVRHDGAPGEAVPPVNVLSARENGPLALRANLVLRDQPIGFRAVLCRCGQSRNKPFCDSSHIDAKFIATGEPGPADTNALAVRDGPLHVRPQKNGPLEIEGNLELCAGTGHMFHRATQVRLCRCGNSRNKPFCDGSHVAAGFVAE